jgi:hypothetical protein
MKEFILLWALVIGSVLGDAAVDELKRIADAVALEEACP